MENPNLDEIKQETVIDNSRLEELIKEEITPEMQNEFFKILKDSRLFLPVDFGPDAFEDIENKKPGDKIEGPGGFDIQFLTDNQGRKAVPLFTSEEMMKEAGARTSVIVIYMSDLADMLKQTDKYSIIAINPFTESSLNMPIEAFLSQFEIGVDMDEVIELLKKKDLSKEEFNEKLSKAVMIIGCVDDGEGTNFVLIWDEEKKPHLPLFTDLDEFQKMFKDHDEVYPAGYHFGDLIENSEGDFVINPASDSIVFSPEIFKGSM